MYRYELVEPNYRPFPYERLMAQQELVALTEGRLVGDRVIETSRECDNDILRRIAFSSAVIGANGDIGTDVARLETVTNLLKYGNRNGSRKQSNYLTHGLHRFTGKFYPQLGRFLLNRARMGPGDLVLDPFVGSGTVLVEAWLLGVDAIGFDVSPLASLIADTKVRLLEVSPNHLDVQLEDFENRLVDEAKRSDLSWSGLGCEEPVGQVDFAAKELAAICGIPLAERQLMDWFPGSVRHKLAIVLRALATVEDPMMKDFLRVCLSDQIRACSQQEPRDLRTRRRRQPIEDAPVLTTLLLKTQAEIEKLTVARELTAGYPWPQPNVSVERRDTRRLRVGVHPILRSRAVDAVVTSPPYATALPYIDTERLSFIILGLMSRQQMRQLEREMIGSREVADRERVRIEDHMESEGLLSLPQPLAEDLYEILVTNRIYAVGFRRRNTAALLYRYFVGMRKSLERIVRVLRPGGQAYLVLGNSRTILGDGTMFPIRTCEHVIRVAKQVGFTWEESIPITVTTKNLAHSKNAIKRNQVIVLRRR